jgi:hypothetical protein
MRIFEISQAARGGCRRGEGEAQADIEASIARRTAAVRCRADIFM